MNWEQVKGNWHQVKGSIKAGWGRLTDDEIEQVAGEEEKFLGLIQERYGVTREEAQRQIEKFSWKM